MEATASGALLWRIPVGVRRAVEVRRPAGYRDLLPARVKIGDGFKDEGHLRYYAAAVPARCGPKKEEKRRMKLAKGLEKDLSALYSMGNLGVDEGEGMAGEIKGQIISEAAEVLLAQLTRLRAEAKEAKKRRKQEKAAKKAAKMKNQMGSESSSSSSSESSDRECETVVKMSSNSLRTASHPMTEAALQTEAKNSSSLNSEPQCCMSSAEAVAVRPPENKIEVCMGGKCKKSGAMELMAELEKKVGTEGAVVGCKCMGKCRDGPNVRVVNQSSVEERLARAARGPLCVGVGLEDVGSIVAEFFEGSNGGVGLLAA